MQTLSLTLFPSALVGRIASNRRHLNFVDILFDWSGGFLFCFFCFFQQPTWITFMLN